MSSHGRRVLCLWTPLGVVSPSCAEERHLLDCSVGGDAGGGDASSVIVPGQLPISIALGPPTSRVPSYPSGGSTGHAPSCSSDAPPAFSDETSSHAPSEDGAGGRRASWSYQHKSSRVCLGEDASTPGFVQVGIGRPPPEDHESSEGDNPPKSPGLRLGAHRPAAGSSPGRGAER